MIRILAIGAIICSFAKLAAAQAVPGNWGLTWSDEFNAGSSELSPWTLETGGGGWGNTEKQVYTSSAPNASVSGGAVQITAAATCTAPSPTATPARMTTHA